jgi:hypothetical protein
LGTKQGASLPVLPGKKHLSHEYIIGGFRIRDSGFRGFHHRGPRVCRDSQECLSQCSLCALW